MYVWLPDADVKPRDAVSGPCAPLASGPLLAGHGKPGSEDLALCSAVSLQGLPPCLSRGPHVQGGQHSPDLQDSLA